MGRRRTQTVERGERTERKRSSTLLRRKLLLLPPLLLALLMLTDDVATGISSQPHEQAQDDPRSNRRFLSHLAFLTALRRHPPSLRVFRALTEICLLLFCTAASLCVWERAEMVEDVGRLLFGPDGDCGDEAYNNEQEYEMASVRENVGRRLKYSGDGSGFMEEDEEHADNNDDDEENSLMDNDGGDDDDDESNEQKRRQPMTKDNQNQSDHWKDDDEDNEEEEDEESPSCINTNNLQRTSPTPPSSAYVAGMALDLLSSILVSLFFFTLSSAEGGTYIDGIGGAGATGAAGIGVDGTAITATELQPQQQPPPLWTQPWSAIGMAAARLAAPVFPLLLFLYSILRSVLPWKRRKALWTIVSRTPWAPYCDVTFRDGFIGDILTSTVRPLQDVAFTAFYILSGLQGWWTASYSIDDAAGPVERSWIVHTVILPACVVSPLWWRFCQNLRQSYDGRKRWPYLGNALKYFLAAEVALFGLFEPDAKENVAWIGCFVLATLYQVWWDCFMDWELLVYDYDAGGYRLRKTRLYQRKSVYYGIFAANFVLRFCWTMTLIPRRYLSQSGMLKDAYSSDFQTFVGPALASAEIIRRSLWGLLRVEWETIKTARQDTFETHAAKGEGGQGKDEEHNFDMMDDSDELEPMHIGGPSGRSRRRGGALSFPMMDPVLEPYFGIARREMSSMTELQILGELCLYACAFTSLGIFAAAHRHVL